MHKILFYNFNPNSVNNIFLGFEELGYDVLTLSPKSVPIANSDLKSQLDNAINTFKPDIIFSYGWWLGNVDINLFCSIIKQRGIFHIFWAYDDPDCFENISLPIGKQCDLVFTSVIEYIVKYKQHNINALFLLHGCDPRTHKRAIPSPNLKHDISMLANNYNVKWDLNYFAYRLNGINNILKPLIEQNFDTMVWGLWWDAKDRVYNLPSKFHSQFIPYGFESTIYSSSKIALGLQSVGNSITHISIRSFEILACATFHLCQYSPALEYYFKKGVHLEWSKSPYETLEIVNFYLKNEFAREKIALKGQAEVYSKHTLKHRAQSVVNIIKSYVKK